MLHETHKPRWGGGEGKEGVKLSCQFMVGMGERRTRCHGKGGCITSGPYNGPWTLPSYSMVRRGLACKKVLCETGAINIHGQVFCKGMSYLLAEKSTHLS